MVVKSAAVVAVPGSKESFLAIVSVISQINFWANEHNLPIEDENSTVVSNIIVENRTALNYNFYQE